MMEEWAGLKREGQSIAIARCEESSQFLGESSKVEAESLW